MGNIIVPREGEAHFFLRCTLDDLAAVDLVLALYRNNVSPTKTSVHATFTVCNYTGYANRALVKSTDWTYVAGDATNKSYCVVNNDKDFTFATYSGGGLVYGFWIYSSVALGGATRCIAAMRFDTPQVCYDGLTIRLRPKIIMGDMA